MSIIDKMAEAIQVEDADCFPTINLQSKDYSRRLAQAAWEAVKAEVLGDDVWPTVMIAMQDVDVANEEGEYDWTLDDMWKAALTAAIKKLEE